MQKLMKAIHQNEKGFTLVELMVVVVIIGILIAIAIPLYGSVQATAREKACYANQRTIDGVISMYQAEGGVTIPGTADGFVVGIVVGSTTLGPYLMAAPRCPNSTNAYTITAGRVVGCPVTEVDVTNHGHYGS